MTKRLFHKTPHLTLERQLWPQPPNHDKVSPDWIYINTLRFWDKRTGEVVWEQDIPEAALNSPFKGACSVHYEPDWGWILVTTVRHENARKLINRLKVPGLTYVPSKHSLYCWPDDFTTDPDYETALVKGW